MKPKVLSSQSYFREWFEKHHDTSKELLVGFYKKSSGHPSIPWPESVDEALCFGWIDGIRLEKLTEDSANARRIAPLTRNKAAK